MRTRSLFLLAALALCAGCADYSGGDNAASEGAVQTVIDLNLFEMKGGTTTWTLDTNSAEFDAAKQKARLSHPLIKLYEGKDLVTEVSAKQGLMDMAEASADGRTGVPEISVTQDAKNWVNYSLVDAK